MKNIVFVILIGLLNNLQIFSQNPQNHWMKYDSPEDAGFLNEKLQKIDELYNKNGAAALMIIYKGQVLYSKGDINRRYDCHSIRKSLMSGLYGIYVDKGIIDITKSLKRIGIDDTIKLTEQEKSARIEDLLKSRSGVYFHALGEGGNMDELRPTRESHIPNTFFYYNNWDFNALNTIFNKETGEDVVMAFYKSIAVPLEMEDFRTFDSRLWLDPNVKTIHAKYDVKISTRDLARFGLLYCNNGIWNNNQILSKEWISKSFEPYSHIDHGNYSESYGFMWWIEELNDSITMYSGRGWGGHLLTIVPEADIVMIKRHDTYKTNGGDGWTGMYVREILNAKILEPKSNPKLLPLEVVQLLTIDTISIPKQDLIKYEQNVFYKERERAIRIKDNKLIFDDSFILYPVSKEKFYIDDYDLYMYFTIEENKPTFNRIE